MTAGWRRLLLAVAAFCLAAGFFLLGQANAHTGPSAAQVASEVADGYLRGLDAGRSAGLVEGRELQATAALPRAERGLARRAYSEGYAAGANDAFGSFDGGWRIGACYVVSLARGQGPITYRIASRAPVRGSC